MSRYNNLIEYFLGGVYRGRDERTGRNEEAVKFDFIEFGFTQ